jgi:hypothetical protein
VTVPNQTLIFLLIITEKEKVKRGEMTEMVNEILTKGELVTKVTEEEMTGRLSLLHKGGSQSDQISHWCPVVLLNITN